MAKNNTKQQQQNNNDNNNNRNNTNNSKKNNDNNNDNNNKNNNAFKDGGVILVILGHISESFGGLGAVMGGLWRPSYIVNLFSHHNLTGITSTMPLSVLNRSLRRLI